MRPALQRLLTRPSSLELLRSLIGTPNSLHNERGRCSGRPRSWKQNHTGIAFKHQCAQANPMNQYVEEDDSKIQEIPPELASLIAIPSKRIYPYGPWPDRLSKASQLDFESDLTQVTDIPRLLDPDRFGSDMRLWALLLEHRYRKFGKDGVAMFWEELRKRGLKIPTTSFLADRFWSTFLSLGIENHEVMGQICEYADDMLASHGRRWHRLYTGIVQHFLLNGTAEEAIRWHERLIDRHPPGPKDFLRMCRVVVMSKDNISALKRIYIANKHRNAYSKVIGALCDQKDFDTAVQWHKVFVKHGDLPKSKLEVDQLVRHLAIYDRPSASRVMDDLSHAGLSFIPSIGANLEVSREMMNLIRGEHFHIKLKAYNDQLGARWFATSWVSLDVAINTVHALGVQEIGPLSLQAIALREPDPRAIVDRINQLKGLGISIGKSLFSRALEKFAWMRSYDSLESLLNSDQHPDELEDSQLQEKLLITYARAKDWVQYRRTIEIQALRSRAPLLEKENLILRIHAREGNKLALQDTLALMQQNGTPVSATSVSVILRNTLRPRQRSKRPISMDISDLEIAITLLSQIAKAGSYVPASSWKEIIKRLGMLGRFRELENLSMFLVQWHTPSVSSPEKITIRKSQFTVPAQLEASHPLHPLAILFSPSFQKAVIEWGFIHALKGDSRRSAGSLELTPVPDVTSGIKLLKRLHVKGVYVDFPAVRKAILHRLVMYYGPGRSNKMYNRRARTNLWYCHGGPDETLRQITSQIDAALNVTSFTKLDVSRLLELRSERSIRRVQLRDRRRRASRERQARPLI